MAPRKADESICERNNKWPVAYKWLAVGTLAAYTAVGSSTVSVVRAEPGPPAVPDASLAAGTPPVRRFEITAGPLETVLESYRIATGVQVRVADPRLLTIASPGVTGVYTADAALHQLLSGTGIASRWISPEEIELQLAPRTESVEVTDRIRALSSPKYTEPLRDTPQTINVIPRALIEQQAATTLRDVLRNVPGLTMTAGEGGVPAGDNLTLRGFSARNDVFVDGVRDLGPQSRDPFNMEQVEVVKGPSSAFAGRGSTGGTINLVSKTASLSRLISGSANFGTDETKRVTADVNTPVPLLGERTGFRMNFMAHESGIAGRDEVSYQRWGVAPALAFGLGTPTRLTLSYFKLKQDNLPDYGIPWVPATNNALLAYRDQPAPVPRENFYGLTARDREETGADMGTVRLEHDFSDTFSFRNQFRYGRSTRDSITTAPRFASNDSLVINRNGPSWLTEDGIWDNQSDVTLRFSTGSVEHSLATGANLTRESNVRRGRTVAGTPAADLFRPDASQPFTGTITPNPIVGDLTAHSQALYVFDTVKLSERWQVNGGFRWDRFAVDGLNTAGVAIDRADQLRSVRGAVVFKPAAHGSIYASYGTSLNPSLEGLSYQAADATLEPEKTYTIEAGTKWDVLGERVLLNAAIFRVEKTNARTPGVAPDDPPQVLEGEQRVAGIELGASGSITRQWKMFGAYTLLDSQVLSSNTPAEVGRSILNTPRNSFNLWTTYRLRQLELGGGARFVDSRFGNSINTRRVDSYWTADLMVSYAVNSHLDLRLNVYNLNDAFYFDRLGGGHLVPGAARSALISTSFRF